MRMSELARTTGVPTATIKWYLREGLLPRGEATARNQAQYDESHVRRLRLIRALIDVGGLTTQQTLEILALVDDPNVPIAEVVGAAHGALARPTALGDSPELLELVDDFIAQRDWVVHPESPTRRELASLLGTMNLLNPCDELSRDDQFAGLTPYADAVQAIADQEVTALPTDVPREEIVEHVILGTVLAERTMGSLRRLAQESRFFREYGH